MSERRDETTDGARENPEARAPAAAPTAAEDGFENPHRTRTDIAVFAVIVLLIVGGIWLTHVISDMRKLQDCLLSGRSNCAPVEQPSGR